MTPPAARTSSQATLDSIELGRFSEDGERLADERTALLEFELRKAHDTIKSLRANLTGATGEAGTAGWGGVVGPRRGVLTRNWAGARRLFAIVICMRACGRVPLSTLQFMNEPLSDAYVKISLTRITIHCTQNITV